MRCNWKWFPSRTGWQHKPPAYKTTLARASLPPSREGSRRSAACKGQDSKAAGRFPSPTRHSAQDDAVTVAEAEAVPNPFPADHSMAPGCSARSPRHLRMPGTPRHGPAPTRCNQSPAAAAPWAQPLKYLIGPFSSPITTLRGVWSQTSLSGLSHNAVNVRKKLHFLPAAPIRSPYVHLRASNYNKSKVRISRKFSCLGGKMAAIERAGSSSLEASEVKGDQW